jgi:hypothetical protein
MKVSARRYRLTMSVLAVIFAVVGLLFLFIPDGVTRFFNSLSAPLGMAPAPLPGRGLFVVLAVAYMYLVTWLAARAARRQDDGISPALLARAKIASSALSFALFLAGSRHFILLANGLVDGALGIIVILLARFRKR